MDRKFLLGSCSFSLISDLIASVKGVNAYYGTCSDSVILML